MNSPSPAATPSAPSADDLTSETAVLARGDWKALSYPVAGCVGRDEWVNGPDDPVAAGARWDAQTVQATAADITGDGRLEVVVDVDCPSDTSSWPEIVVVWDVTGVEPRPFLTIRDLYFRGSTTTVGDRSITVEGPTVGGDDAFCCLTHRGLVRYEWDGFLFQLAEKTETPAL